MNGTFTVAAVQGAAVDAADATGSASTAHAPTRGFNVIGHLTANLGLGVVARNVVNLMRSRGFAVTAFNVEAGLGRENRETPADVSFVQRIEDLPHRINVVVLAGVTLVHFLRQHGTYFRSGERITAAISFWELPALPPRWLPDLDRLDAVVAMSDFIAASHAFALSGPVVLPGRTPVEIPGAVAADRQRFGIPLESVAFVTSFEPHSDPDRKNPAAVVRAFLAAAKTDPGVWLVVRINNAASGDGSNHPVVSELVRLCEEHPRVQLVTSPMTYAEVLSLYASCDAYVSLHRAEGLGLGMAEAMLLGKPVIATGWSGNTAFMDHRSACLVRYRLIPVNRESGPYRASEIDESTMWAEPVTADAAAWMLALSADPALRRRIGAAAADRMKRYNEEARRADFLEELYAVAEQREALALPPLPDGNAAQPVHGKQLARLQAMERELNWIKGRPSYRLAEAIRGVARAFTHRKERF